MTVFVKIKAVGFTFFFTNEGDTKSDLKFDSRTKTDPDQSRVKQTKRKKKF